MSFIELLDDFNRKERYHLLDNALKEPFLQLNENFRKRLGCEIGIKIPKDPKETWVAMDYHLNWIAVAIELHKNHGASIPKNKKLCDPNKDLFKANQQDVDLVVAFEDGADTHFVMIEAKAYEPRWTTEQMKPKLERLNKIFKAPINGISPHLVLATPSKEDSVSEIRELWAQKREQCSSEYPIEQIHYLELDLCQRYKIGRNSHDSDTIEFKKLEYPK